MGTILACRHLNITIATNEFLCIVGPSGCGKTSLLHAMAGLVTINKGTISINDRPVTGPGPDRSLIFQQPHLLPWLTVWKNVLFSIEINRAASETDKRRAVTLLEQMELTTFMRAYPKELSGGMQQRVNIARALLTQPEVLLLDEPFSTLDAQTREVQQVELQKALTLLPTTAVFITHDIDEAVLLGDRVIVLTPRPAQVRGEIPVDRARPRAVECKEEAWFRKLCREVRVLLNGADSEAQIAAPVQHQSLPEYGAKVGLDM